MSKACCVFGGVSIVSLCLSKRLRCSMSMVGTCFFVLESDQCMSCFDSEMSCPGGGASSTCEISASLSVQAPCSAGSTDFCA